MIEDKLVKKISTNVADYFIYKQYQFDTRGSLVEGIFDIDDEHRYRLDIIFKIEYFGAMDISFSSEGDCLKCIENIEIVKPQRKVYITNYQWYDHDRNMYLRNADEILKEIEDW